MWCALSIFSRDQVERAVIESTLLLNTFFSGGLLSTVA